MKENIENSSFFSLYREMLRERIQSVLESIRCIWCRDLHTQYKNEMKTTKSSTSRLFNRNLFLSGKIYVMIVRLDYKFITRQIDKMIYLFYYPFLFVFFEKFIVYPIKGAIHSRLSNTFLTYFWLRNILYVINKRRVLQVLSKDM